MTLKEAHILTLRVLKQVMEEKLDQHNVQLAQVSNACGEARPEHSISIDVLGDTRRRLRDLERDQAQGIDRRHVMDSFRCTKYTFLLCISCEKGLACLQTHLSRSR